MSLFSFDEQPAPIFKAVSSTARQIYQLVNCIRFAPKVLISISAEGIRFSVEESRVLQGVVFLEKTLFTTYDFNLSSPDENEPLDPPSFQISMPALLETLQIFGFTDNSYSRFSRPGEEYGSNIRPHSHSNQFSNQALGMNGICRLSYEAPGSPFSIILEETGVTTTCNLNTYDPESIEEIPFNRDELEVKIIMQSRYLFDAISEIATMTTSIPTSSSRLTISASPHSPFLSLSASGPLGSCAVEYGKSRELLETFFVRRKWCQSYKFELVKVSLEAMKLASKVSFRSDQQGVLSLQFMIEVEGGMSFVEFRFVPFLPEDGDSQGEDEEVDREGEEN